MEAAAAIVVVSWLHILLKAVVLGRASTNSEDIRLDFFVLLFLEYRRKVLAKPHQKNITIEDSIKAIPANMSRKVNVSFIFSTSHILLL